MTNPKFKLGEQVSFGKNNGGTIEAISIGQLGGEWYYKILTPMASYQKRPKDKWVAESKIIRPNG